MNEDMMSAMYAQDETHEKQPQPEQLRLAGKATVMTINDRQIAIPRVEYVELLETRLTKAEKIIEEQNALIRKLVHRIDRNANIAQRKINAVETETKQTGHWTRI